MDPAKGMDRTGRTGSGRSQASRATTDSSDHQRSHETDDDPYFAVRRPHRLSLLCAWPRGQPPRPGTMSSATRTCWGPRWSFASGPTPRKPRGRPRPAPSARSTGSPPSSAATTRRASSAAGRRPSIEPTKVSPELFELLLASDRWRERSGGAFDPRVQALTELWSRCARLDRLPTADELAGAKALMARPAWRLDAAAGTAEHLTACPLSLNSIAKGYIIGRACDVAFDRERGVRGVLLNIGGDVRVVGDVARTVGVAPPVGDSETAEPIARVEVRDRSVATSGSSQRGFRVRGRGIRTSSTPGRASPPGGWWARPSSRSGPRTPMRWPPRSTCSPSRTACAWPRPSRAPSASSSRPTGRSAGAPGGPATSDR